MGFRPSQEEQPTTDQIGWRIVRELLAGIGWGLLGFFLFVLAIFPPFVDWLLTSAMGEVSPAHDLLTGYVRSYWGAAAAVGLGALLQLRLLALCVIRIRYYWREHQRADDEWGPLRFLDGPLPNSRRDELKKQMDQYWNGVFSHVILVMLAAAVLVLYFMVLFTDGPTPLPLAPQVHIPILQAELDQIESGQLETAEVWVHPRVEAGRLPRMWGSGYRSLTVRCHIIGTAPGDQWIDILVPEAMEFSPSIERPFRESQSIPWNLEHAQLYQVRYTSNFHLAVEITPVI